MSDITDRDLLDLLLEHESELTETSREAFQSMAEQLAGGRKLSAKQRDWCLSVAKARQFFVEESLNLYSSGKIPNGIAKVPTPGEVKAQAVLALRPLLPPSRRIS